MNKEKNSISKITYILAWGIIPLAYLSWCLFTVGYKSDWLVYAGGLLGEITILAAGIIADSVMSKSAKLKKEIADVNVFLLLISVLGCVVVSKEFDTWILPGVYIMLATMIMTNIILIRKSDYRLKNLVSWFKSHAGILVLLLLTAILSLDENMYQFKWDGLLYYDAVKSATIGSVSSVALYGHVAVSSGVIYRFFAALFSDVAAGMIVANIVVLLGAATAFYGLLKTIFTERKEYEYCIGTACFAFSPYLLGMVNYFSTDWFSVCLVVILLYYICKKEWIMTVIMACGFCLTKEPALIAYTGICFGMVISDLFKDGTVKEKIIGIIKSAYYYYMLIPYFIWFGTYKIMGQWSAGSGGFKIDMSYVLEKIKVFAVLNFNWILTVFALVLVIVIIAKKSLKGNAYWLIPAVSGNAFLLAFNLVFKTANHPRYIDSFVTVNIVLAVAGMFILFKQKINAVICGIVAAVSLASCFMTFDPVSLMLFESADTGHGKLIHTAQYPYGDSSIYNKQMLWMEKPVSEAIGDALTENTKIVIPAYNESVYAVDGMSRTITMPDACEQDVQYYDIENNVRVAYASEHVNNAGQIIINHVNTAAGYVVDGLIDDEETLSVIYIKGVNGYTASDKLALVDSKQYSYRGWVITRDILKRK